MNTGQDESLAEVLGRGLYILFSNQLQVELKATTNPGDGATVSHVDGQEGLSAAEAKMVLVIKAIGIN
jgi:hypothetical protein